MTPDSKSLDADRSLVLGYVPEPVRSAIAALWYLDAALGAVVAGGREPLISQIKLTWWRDSLAKLDFEPPPPQPILQDLATHAVPRGVDGRELSTMAEAWLVLLSKEPLTPPELDAYADARGGALFRHSARFLGEPLRPWMEQAGQGWALADLARHSGKSEAEAALAAASTRFRTWHRWPRALRPLGMLATLAGRDAARGLERLEPHGSPPRVARMLRHRLTGL